MKQIRTAVVVLVIIALGAGCASFRVGELPRPGPMLPIVSQSARPSIAVYVDGSSSLGGTARDIPAPMMENWTKWITESYERSGQFSKVTMGQGTAEEYRADVSVLNTGDPHIAMAVLSGLTMTLIPAKATDHIKTTTVFRNRDGDELAVIEKSESVDTWFQLFLVFTFGVNSPKKVVGDVFADLTRATLIAAQAQGVFGSRP